MWKSLRTPPRATSPASATCRRQTRRWKQQPVSVTCWSSFEAPSQAVVIEADEQGARLLLPWLVEAGETISVAVADQLGFYQTRRAQVAWTERLEVSGRVVAGLAFDQRLTLAS